MCFGCSKNRLIETVLFEYPQHMFLMRNKENNFPIRTLISGMRKFRIDQDFLIEHWHMIYEMSVVFAEIYV